MENPYDIVEPIDTDWDDYEYVPPEPEPDGLD